MNNFKKLALALVVGAMALSFSAFTNAHTTRLYHRVRVAKAGMITEDFIVQPTSNNFQPNSSPNTNLCHSTATRQCVYDVTTSGQSDIPEQTSYTASEIDGYVTAGDLVADPNSSAALY